MNKQGTFYIFLFYYFLNINKHIHITRAEVK